MVFSNLVINMYIYLELAPSECILTMEEMLTTYSILLNFSSHLCPVLAQTSSLHPLILMSFYPFHYLKRDSGISVSFILQ